MEYGMCAVIEGYGILRYYLELSTSHHVALRARSNVTIFTFILSPSLPFFAQIWWRDRRGPAEPISQAGRDSIKNLILLFLQIKRFSSTLLFFSQSLFVDPFHSFEWLWIIPSSLCRWESEYSQTITIITESSHWRNENHSASSHDEPAWESFHYIWCPSTVIFVLNVMQPPPHSSEHVFPIPIPLLFLFLRSNSSSLNGGCRQRSLLCSFGHKKNISSSSRLCMSSMLATADRCSHFFHNSMVELVHHPFFVWGARFTFHAFMSYFITFYHFFLYFVPFSVHGELLMEVQISGSACVTKERAAGGWTVCVCVWCGWWSRIRMKKSKKQHRGRARESNSTSAPLNENQ